MRPCKWRRGTTMLELIVVGLASVLIGAALTVMLKTTYSSQSVTNGQNQSDAEARRVVDMLADKLRNAQQFPSGSTYIVLASASASDVTIYNNATGDTTRYWRDASSNLNMTKTVAGAATTTTLLAGLTALTFTYYINSGTLYTTTDSSWVLTASPSAPTASEIPKIGAINISATATINGFARTIQTFVRLRNSPRLP